jgi:hypothetical protein
MHGSNLRPWSSKEKNVKKEGERTKKGGRQVAMIKICEITKSVLAGNSCLYKQTDLLILNLKIVHPQSDQILDFRFIFLNILEN